MDIINNLAFGFEHALTVQKSRRRLRKKRLRGKQKNDTENAIARD